MTGRYSDTEIAALRVPGHPEVRYLRRRFLPPADTQQTLAVHTVAPGDRIDLIAAAYLGDPAQFWRICDAAPVTHPDELTSADRVGGPVRVPLPRA
ncbi:hypothetical protein [Catenuloplanes japonicus]|uniref:hypothetical protein n=1 Tax=Catenuloplanes japonicus TaxID=33876 RepID=UPI000524D822|nr:hypothetical protein [Catenuloplanes japonicus]